MLEFTPITQEHDALLRRYYEGCDYGLCEYSAGTKLMWGEILHPAFTEAAGCLIVRNESDGRPCSTIPFPARRGTRRRR